MHEKELDQQLEGILKRIGQSVARGVVRGANKFVNALDKFASSDPAAAVQNIATRIDKAGQNLQQKTDKTYDEIPDNDNQATKKTKQNLKSSDDETSNNVNQAAKKTKQSPKSSDNGILEKSLKSMKLRPDSKAIPTPKMTISQFESEYRMNPDLIPGGESFDNRRQRAMTGYSLGLGRQKTQDKPQDKPQDKTKNESILYEDQNKFRAPPKDYPFYKVFVNSMRSLKIDQTKIKGLFADFIACYRKANMPIGKIRSQQALDFANTRDQLIKQIDPHKKNFAEAVNKARDTMTQAYPEQTNIALLLKLAQKIQPSRPGEQEAANKDSYAKFKDAKIDKKQLSYIISKIFAESITIFDLIISEVTAIEPLPEHPYAEKRNIKTVKGAFVDWLKKSASNYKWEDFQKWLENDQGIINIRNAFAKDLPEYKLDKKELLKYKFARQALIAQKQTGSSKSKLIKTSGKDKGKEIGQGAGDQPKDEIPEIDPSLQKASEDIAAALVSQGFSKHVAKQSSEEAAAALKKENPQIDVNGEDFAKELYKKAVELAGKAEPPKLSGKTENLIQKLSSQLLD